MKEYKSNINNYVDEELLEAEVYKIGDEIGFLPQEEQEANFCTLQTIKKADNIFTISLLIENEWTGEKYKKDFEVKKGSEIEMVMLAPNLACFLPPERIPVLVEVLDIFPKSITIKPTGILNEYTSIFDKNDEHLQQK